MRALIGNYIAFQVNTPGRRKGSRADRTGLAVDVTRPHGRDHFMLASAAQRPRCKVEEAGDSDTASPERLVVMGYNPWGGRSLDTSGLAFGARALLVWSTPPECSLEKLRQKTSPGVTFLFPVHVLV